jgi:hypothetical protein
MLFSQRKGFKPVKSIIQSDSMDEDLRNSLWNAFNSQLLTTHEDDELLASLSKANKATRIYNQFCQGYFKTPIENLNRTAVAVARLQNYFLTCEWYEVYDFLEFAAKHCAVRGEATEFMKRCNLVLQRELSAYRFVAGVITEVTTDEEISAIEEALIASTPFKPVTIHLKQALDLLADRKSPDYRNSIKESISAVESMCNLLSGSKTTLGQSLKQIEKKTKLHPALKKAFDSLYGYTNDANGIRHALLDESNLDFEDAKFMLVSCSAFVNYLKAKLPSTKVTHKNPRP